MSQRHAALLKGAVAQWLACRRSQVVQSLMIVMWSCDGPVMDLYLKVWTAVKVDDIELHTL